LKDIKLSMDVQVFLKCLLFILIIAVNDSQNKHCLPLSFFLSLMFSEKAKEFKKNFNIFFANFMTLSENNINSNEAAEEGIY
jgi:hypothetical protein